MDGFSVGVLVKLSTSSILSLSKDLPDPHCLVGNVREKRGYETDPQEFTAVIKGFKKERKHLG